MTRPVPLDTNVSAVAIVTALSVEPTGVEIFKLLDERLIRKQLITVDLRGGQINHTRQRGEMSKNKHEAQNKHNDTMNVPAENQTGCNSRTAGNGQCSRHRERGIRFNRDR